MDASCDGGAPHRRARTAEAVATAALFVLLSSLTFVGARADAGVPGPTAPAPTHRGLSPPAPVQVPTLRTLSPGSSEPWPDDWPTYMYDPERTGDAVNFTTFGVDNVSSLRPAWSVPFNRSLLGSLIVVRGVAYVGSESGYLNAVNVSTGAVLPSSQWAVPYLGNSSYSQCGAPGPIHTRNDGILATATYSNGTLYQAGGNTSFYILSTNGTILHRIDVGNSSRERPYYDDYNWASSLVYRGSVYTGLAAICNNNAGYGGPGDTRYIQGQLLQINLTTDQIAHVFNATNTTGGDIWSTPALDPSTNLIWTTTGNENVSNQAPSNCQYPRSVVALNATTLGYQGAYQVGGAGQDFDFGAGPTVFHAADGQELVGVVNKDGEFLVVNATPASPASCMTTLSTVWTHAFGDYGHPGSIAPAAFDGRTLYVAADGTSGNGSDEVVAFDPGNGTIAWTHWLNTPYPAVDHAGVVVANGLVFVAAENDSNGGGAGPGAEVQVLDALNGRELWRANFNQTISAEVVVAEGHLFVATGNETNIGPGFLDAFDLPASSPWINETGQAGPGGQPPASWGASIAWDPSADAYVAFGGCLRGDCPSDQTWSFSDGVWQNLTAAVGAPPARDRASMAYDSALGGLLLYGGCGAVICPLNDTWLYSDGTWTNLTASACQTATACPGGLFSAGMADLRQGPIGDPTPGIFGGCSDGACDRQSATVFAYNESSGWFALPGSSQAVGEGPAVAYDPAAGAVVVQVGELPCGARWCDSNVTELYNLSLGWVAVAGPNHSGPSPPARANATLFVDSNGSAEFASGVTLFGGWNASTGTPQAGVWQLQCAGAACRWSEVTSSTAPSAFSWSAGAGSGGSDNPMLLGGTRSPNGTPSPGWWELGIADSLRESASPDPVVAGSPLTLNSTPSGGIGPFLEFSWAFSNGTRIRSTANQLVVLAPARGTVNGTATVVDLDGAVAGSAFSVPILSDLRVALSANLSPTEIGAVTAFRGTVPPGVPGGPFSLRWSFGDGTFGLGTRVNHTYTTAGLFEVNVTVRDSVGDQNVSSLDLSVAPRPTLNVSANRTSADVDQPVELQPFLGDGVPPYTLRWAFSDGTVLIGAGPVVHSFSEDVPAWVYANLTDSVGGTNSTFVPFAVFPPLSLVVNASSSLGRQTVVDAPIVFTAEQVGGRPWTGTPPCYWSFGDGTNGTGTTVSHTFLDPGRYDLAVRLEDANGVNTTANLSIIVSPAAPVVHLTNPGHPVVSTAEIVAIGAAAAGVTALAGVLIVRRRRR